MQSLYGITSPILAVLVMAAIYLMVAVVCYLRLAQMQKNWETLPRNHGTTQKDRECLETCLTLLESRKQMLVVESELNRALLTNEFRDLKKRSEPSEGQVRAMAVISSAADLASTFVSVEVFLAARPATGKVVPVFHPRSRCQGGASVRAPSGHGSNSHWPAGIFNFASRLFRSSV